MKPTFGALLRLAGACSGQAPIRATVDFSQHVRAWDGFGVNYVETAQTRDYQADPQEYGGFSLLTEAERQQILDLIFGPDGLKPGLLKMFLDSHHQGTVKTDKFDHTTTTRWIRYFAKEGLKKTRARGGDLTIITTLYGPPHGFINFGANRWFGDWRSLGNDILRAKRPEPHSWVTSRSWSKMDVNFINEMRGNIYATKVNGIIPWAAMQRSAKWVGGDPNPGTAFRVSEDGKYTVEPGYYLYKQVAPAGQPGMAVAHVVSTDTEVGLIAFARARTRRPDALVVLNLAKIAKPLAIRVLGSAASSFAAWRTGPEERYAALGDHNVQGGILSYTAPPGTVTTFYAKP